MCTKAQSESGSPILVITIYFYSNLKISYPLFEAHVSNTLAMTVICHCLMRLQVCIQSTSVCTTAVQLYINLFLGPSMRLEIASSGKGCVKQWIIPLVYSRLSYWSMTCTTTNLVIIVLKYAKGVILTI